MRFKDESECQTGKTGRRAPKGEAAFARPELWNKEVI